MIFTTGIGWWRGINKGVWNHSGFHFASSGISSMHHKVLLEEQHPAASVGFHYSSRKGSKTVFLNTLIGLLEDKRDIHAYSNKKTTSKELLWLPSCPSQSKENTRNHPHRLYHVPLSQSKYSIGVNCSWLEQWDLKTRLLLSAIFKLCGYLKSLPFM